MAGPPPTPTDAGGPPGVHPDGPESSYESEREYSMKHRKRDGGKTVAQIRADLRARVAEEIAAAYEGEYAAVAGQWQRAGLAVAR